VERTQITDFYELRRTTVRREDGSVVSECPVARTGVQSYPGPDGGVVRHLRLPEEVFAQDSIESYVGAPIRIGHDFGATDRVGTVCHARMRDAETDDGPEWVLGTLAIHDTAAIDAAESGQGQLSAGYTALLEDAPGVHHVYGEYDLIQRDIVIDHIALVDRARAGATATLQFDGETIALHMEPAPEFGDPETPINIVDVADEKNTPTAPPEPAPAPAADHAIVKSIEDRLAAIEARPPVDVERMVADRAALLTAAREVLGDALDERAPTRDLQITICKSVDASIDLADRSDEYVAGLCDATVRAARAGKGSVASLKIGDGPAKLSDADAIRVAHDKRFRDACSVAVSEAHKRKGL
jgi:hypothetical protein